jgi:hypothetical protein
MKSVKLKILFVLVMLFPVTFSCKDKNECRELEVSPYFSMQRMEFKGVDVYSRNVKTGNFKWETAVSQDYPKMVYPCDSIAFYFECPPDELLFHSQNIRKDNFSFMNEAFACNSKRNGYAGTRELIDKIYISSNYDFDETHNRNDNLSDIVDIFAYTTNGKDSWMPLDVYNKNSPYEAPKRFHLLLTRKPTRSMKQQFVIKYYMKNEPGEASKYFIITTPVFQVR